MQVTSETTVTLTLTPAEMRQLLDAVAAFPLRFQREIIESPKFSLVDPVLQDRMKVRHKLMNQMEDKVNIAIWDAISAQCLNQQETAEIAHTMAALPRD